MFYICVSCLFHFQDGYHGDELEPVDESIGATSVEQRYDDQQVSVKYVLVNMCNICVFLKFHVVYIFM